MESRGSEARAHAGIGLRGDYSGGEYCRVRHGRISALASRSVLTERLPNAMLNSLAHTEAFYGQRNENALREPQSVG